jgi:predicted nucleotidyltransferase
MTLINYLKNKNTRLIFGKKEIEIIEKQLLGLNLTPSEKTRLSRDIRKKLQAIKELSRYREEFKLKKSQEIKLITQESEEIILNKLGDQVDEIILFGSHAKGDNLKDSDIDLVIKLKKTNISSTKLRAQLSGNLNEKVDIQIYSALPKKIQKEINKTGKKIYKNGQN